MLYEWWRCGILFLLLRRKMACVINRLCWAKALLCIFLSRCWSAFNTRLFFSFSPLPNSTSRKCLLHIVWTFWILSPEMVLNNWHGLIRIEFEPLNDQWNSVEFGYLDYNARRQRDDKIVVSHISGVLCAAFNHSFFSFSYGSYRSHPYIYVLLVTL